MTPATRALVVIDPNNPTGAVYPPATRRALLDFADRHGLLILADEVYGDLGFDGPIEPYGRLDPDAPIISFSSLSKAYLAPGWRTGWMAIGRSPRLDDVVAAVRKLADGRLCSVVPMQYAIAPALDGDRSHQLSFRKALKARADLTIARLCAMPGVSCVAPTAAFYAMPQVALPQGKTDEDYVKALLHATGVLCVYGSGFGLPAEAGIPADRIPRVARRAERDLRPDGDLHGTVPAVTAPVTRINREFLRGRMLQTVLRSRVWRSCSRSCGSRARPCCSIYVSALLAMGISPAGPAARTSIEPEPQAPRLPRWLAILAIYLAVIGVVAVAGPADRFRRW